MRESNMYNKKQNAKNKNKSTTHLNSYEKQEDIREVSRKNLAKHQTTA